MFTNLIKNENKLTTVEKIKLSTEEKIKKKYDKKTNIKIAKDNAITDYKKAVLENKQKLLPQLSKITELKRKLKEPEKRRRLSNILVFVSLILTIITTCVSISGGFEKYSNIFGQTTFISFIVGTQFMVLFISGIKPYLLTKNLIICLNVSSVIQVFLLFVSISYNFIFLYSSGNSIYWTIVTLVLCTIFDISILLVMSISISVRFNYEGRQKSNNSIFTRLIGLITKIVEYKITNIENKIDNILVESNINDLDIKKYLDFAKSNIEENNKLMSYKDISKNLDITESKGKKIHKSLIEKGVIKTENKKTYLVN